MNNTDAFVKTCIAPDDTTCLCGDRECSGLTAAFSILQDARQRFIDLDGINVRQKQAYLRHIPHRNRASNHLALHHFHPVLLWEDPLDIPKTLSLGKAVEMRMPMSEKDKLTLPNGMPAYFYCPNYPKSLVKQDLENLTLETRICETASLIVEEHDDVTNKKEESDVVEILDIPEHVAIEEDDLSDVSSIERVVEHKKDAITFQELVEASIVCQVSLNNTLSRQIQVRHSCLWFVSFTEFYSFLSSNGRFGTKETRTRCKTGIAIECARMDCPL